MKSWARLAVACYVGFFIYTALVYVFGDSGTVSLRQLIAYRDKLEAAISEQQSVGERLVQIQRDLLTDPAEIRLRARSLGYFASNEIPVRVESSERGASALSMGRLVRPPHSSASNAAVFRATGLASAIGAFVLMSILAGRYGNHRKRRR